MQQFLIALFIICMLLPIVLESYRGIMGVKYDDEYAQDEIVSYQIRKMLLLADNIICLENELNFDYKGKSWRMYFVNNHVILTPGVQIEYTNVEDAFFKIEDHVLFIYLLRNGRYSKIALASEQ